MKKLLKAMFYVVALTLLGMFCIYALHYHPEIQFAFLVPGVFFILVSGFITDFTKRTRLAKGR